uniref:LicD/FKTN/FKRP nucleotidyltransferase domain-containing protein n=1 Tax=Romanomermis culicivorax TaxID=13658 RepID=A0A915KN61_ROMCU
MARFKSQLLKLSRRRTLFFLLILFVCCFLFWSLIKLNDYQLTLSRRCVKNAEEERYQLNLLVEGDKILSALNITHFLCYGTLWAALRRGKLLPWKRNVDFCILNEDLAEYDELYFRRNFFRQGFDIEYKATEGYYIVRPKKVEYHYGSLRLHLFEKRPNLKIIRRIGIKYRLLPDTSESIHSFPSRLIKSPINTLSLSNLKFPAPREGIEIQKYHYKNDWWIEIKPEECK